MNFVILLLVMHQLECCAMRILNTGIRRTDIRILRMSLVNKECAKESQGVSTADYIPVSIPIDKWEGHKDGFDWQLERARRALPTGFAPLSMLPWRPNTSPNRPSPAPNWIDDWTILFNNALQMAGMKTSVDGAPLVQGVNRYKGNPIQLLSRIADGNLAELAGGPLFLLLAQYYQQYGPVFKLAFGPKSFIVVSDPVMVKHILKESPMKYDKGILAEILEPIMGKGLIPADPETWKVRRKAIVPGFHKAWLNAMVSIVCVHTYILLYCYCAVADWLMGLVFLTIVKC